MRITEIMYHPPVSTAEDGWDEDEFEFLELMNAGSAPIDLSGIRFTEGIEFDFATCLFDQLPAGRFALIVKNRAAFECRYGTGLTSQILGEYHGSLSNSGETIMLKDLGTGTLASFAYADAWYPLTDGQGRSLVLVDPAHGTPDALGQKASWRASAGWGGSPGKPD